jgi:dihydroorotase
MKCLLKQVKIVDPNASKNLQVQDVLIQDGIIIAIENNIEPPVEAQILNSNNLLISPGFTDLFAHFNDPGFEQKETLVTGAAAATAGGYTRVATIPNTQPVLQNKAQVEYVINAAHLLPVYLHPLGAISKNIAGEDLAEMIEMHQAGAVAFTDGTEALQNAGLMLKALQYVKAFSGTIIQLPIEKSIARYGAMNEGVVSTRLGIPGIPAIAEELILQRDIELLRYTGSKLHVSGVSTSKALQLIASAKNEGLLITCSVTPYHLYYCDEDVQNYNTHFKVNPPLRLATDRDALKQAVLSGLIDAIATHHLPQDIDSKICEFEYAKNGIIGLQTAFAMVNTALPELSETSLAQLFSIEPRKILNLPSHSIEVGNVAELTLYSKSGNTILTKQNNKSRSMNAPFMNQSLEGFVWGTINKGIIHKN